MSVFTASLNSGSNANCYYAGNSQEAVLIDAGLSCRETEKRIKELGLSMEKIKALFISHEHADHITGMAGISKKYRLPVYITEKTLRYSNMYLDPALVRPFNHARPVTLGNLSVTPFRKSHDAGDPHSFMVSSLGVNIGIITDIGYACKRVIKYFSQCHAVFLETNYCEDMLARGDYPFHLKKRIRSDEGHLSNIQALELFRNYRSEGLRLLVLSHLSRNNNKPDLVESLFKPHAGNTRIVVASRYEPTPVFTLEPQLTGRSTDRDLRRSNQRKPIKDKRQLSLF